MYSPAHKHVGGRQEDGEFESSQDFKESPCEAGKRRCRRGQSASAPRTCLLLCQVWCNGFPGFADNWSRSTLDVLMSC